MSQTKAQLVEGLNVNTSAPADSLVIDSSGNVGLGTSSPIATLHSANSSGSVPQILVERTGAANGQYGLYLPNDSGTDCGLDIYDDKANVSRVRISSAGNVGIGTTSPGNNLEVRNTGVTTLQVAYTGNSSFTITEEASGESRLTCGGIGGFLTVYTGTTPIERARIDASGRLLVGTSTSLSSNALLQLYKSSGVIEAIIDSDSLANNQYVEFAAIGGARASSIGVSKHSGITNPCAYLNLDREDDTNTFLWVDNSGNLRISTSVLHIGTTSGTVVGTQTSDERIKNIIGPIEYGLDILKQIEPVRYTLKSEPKTEKLGFIAQQLLPLVPESVFDTNEHIEGEPKDAPTKLGMEYISLIPVLVNAIKELSAKNESLKARLDAAGI